MAEMDVIEEQIEIPRKSEEVCGTFPFSWLTDLMEEFERTRKMSADLKMKKLFSKKFTSAFVGKPEESIYPLLRLLLPLFDLDRGRYNLKEKKIAHTYIQALNLAPTSKPAQALLNFKDIKKVEDATGDGSISGNLGAVLCAVLKDRVTDKPSNEDLKSVNELLDRLARAENESVKVQVIQSILKRFNRFEQKWLMRIVLGGDLKIGLSKDVILKKLGKGLADRFDSCMNLRTVVDEFDPSVGAVVTSSSIGVKPMSNFAPMLADGVFKAAGHTGQGLVAAVEKYMDREGFFMDEKMDGERLQVHVDHGEIRMWSRKGKEYTNLYGSIADVVRRSLKDGVTTCIFDGEVLSWDNRKADGEGEIEPFGSVKTVAKQENGRRDSQHSQPMDVSSSSSSTGGDGADRWLIFVVFDILYLEGDKAKEIVTKAGGLGFEGSEDVGSICNLPLFVRRKILERVIIQQPKRFVIVPSEYVPPTSQFGDVESRKCRIEKFFNSICFEVTGLVTKGGEGIVAKKETSLYELNSRTGGWVKMKPEYGGQVPELDLIVIGAHYGGGKGYRARGISKFTLGVSDGEDPITGRVRYRTVIRVGTGYSFDELEHIRKLIDPALGGVGVPWEKKNLPKELADWNVPNNEDKPNFYLPPEKSFIMEIKCAELTKCLHKTFSAEITCRFPRVQRIRYDDKEIEKVLTMDELREMMAGNGFRSDVANVKKYPSRFAKKKGGAVNGASGASSYKSSLGTVDNSLTVSHDMARSDISRQGIFAPNTYMVEDANSFKVLNPVTNTTVKTYSKEELQKMISTHGGIISANPINKGGDQPVKTLLVVGNKPLNVKYYMEAGEYDLLDFRYVLDCVASNCRRPPTSLEYVSMSRATRNRFGRELDALDLSFYEETELKDITRLFDTLDQRIERLRKEISSSSLGASAKPTSKPPPSKKTKTDAAEVVQPYSRSEIKAKKRMIKKQDKMKEMNDWRQIYETLLFEEREVLEEPETRLYRKNVVIYLDIYENMEQGSGVVVSHLLMALGARMFLRGATISSVLDQNVTHIVVDPVALNLDPSRASTMHSRIFELQKAVEGDDGTTGVLRPAARYMPLVVSPAWAERALLWADQPTPQPQPQPLHEAKKDEENDEKMGGEKVGGEKLGGWGEGSEEEDWVEVRSEETVHLANYFAVAMDL